MSRVTLRLEVRRIGCSDGTEEWVAEVPNIRGCVRRGTSREHAVSEGMARALRSLASAIEGTEEGREMAECMFDIVETDPA